MLCRLAVSMMRVLQPNPILVPTAESTMQLECEQDSDPYELLGKALDDVKQHFCAHSASLDVRHLSSLFQFSVSLFFFRSMRQLTDYVLTKIRMKYS